jgi:hypothetical protein
MKKFAGVGIGGSVLDHPGYQKPKSSTIKGNAERAEYLRKKGVDDAKAAKAAREAAAKPGMFKRAGAAIARNKKTAIGVGAGVAAVGGVGGYYAMRKRRRAAQEG